MSPNPPAPLSELAASIAASPVGRLTRKRCSVLCVRLTGFGTRLEHRQAESQLFLEAAIRVAEEFDGTIVAIEPDSLCISWGATSPYPFHELRATTAALAMASAAPELLSLDLRLHMAVTNGTVIAGLCGTKKLLAPTVVGDCVS
ncbi:hypothetical protein FG879_30055, partial [Pseudomonas sp. 4B]|nr:hypothetical protein [Pseudomonas sp. 4B]